MSPTEDIASTPVRTTVELGARLRAARLDQGLTQAELADIADIARTHLVHIEKGKTTERLEQVFRLTSLLGLEVVVRPRGSQVTR